MNKVLGSWMGGRTAVALGILIFGIALVTAPKAFAWGRRALGGGAFGGGGFGAEAGPGFGGEGAQSTGPSQMYVYPNKGQSPQQEQNDRGQCYTWAAQQSGFDPANPRVPSAPPPAGGAPRGGLLKGAAGGAALGAIGGAIGGNAGKGAAIGAGTGAVFGGMRRRSWAEQQQSQQNAYMEQQQNMLAQGRSNFNQAFGVCMTARGYTVG